MGHSIQKRDGGASDWAHVALRVEDMAPRHGPSIRPSGFQVTWEADDWTKPLQCSPKGGDGDRPSSPRP